MPIRADGVQIGYSPRFTAVTAATGTLVRDRFGICRGVQVNIASPGSTIDIYDGQPFSFGVSILHIDASQPPKFYQLDAEYGNIGNVGHLGLYIVIAGAVTDCIVLTGGL